MHELENEIEKQISFDEIKFDQLSPLQAIELLDKIKNVVDMYFNSLNNPIHNETWTNICNVFEKCQHDVDDGFYIHYLRIFNNENINVTLRKLDPEGSEPDANGDNCLRKTYNQYSNGQLFYDEIRQKYPSE